MIKNLPRLPIWAALIIPVLITTLALWIPFGFALTGLVEEWDVLATFTANPLYFIVTPSSPLVGHALRPLTILPHAIAYLLDPHSFNYWNILLMLAFLVKGSAASYLIWKITRSLGWAMLMGVLLLVFPADTMQFSFRCLHIHWALAVQLIASSLWIIAYEQTRPLSSYGLGCISALLFFVACCLYEGALMLAPLPLLIPFVREGLRGLRARMTLSAIWVAGLSLYPIYVFLTARLMPSSYQGEVLASAVTTFFHNLPKLFTRGALRCLVGGWYDAIQIVLSEFSHYGYLLIATGAIAIFFIWGSKKEVLSSKAVPLRLASSGILLMLLGYIPFLLHNHFVSITQRTFLWSTPGAVIAWIALLIALSHFTKWLSKCCAIALIFFGLGSQLFQMNHYTQCSDIQRNLLKNIVEQFDGQLDGKTLLVLDDSNQLGSFWTLPKTSLVNALTYLYGHVINPIEICRMPSGKWQHPDHFLSQSLCIEQENSWVFRSSVEDLVIPKEQLTTISINASSTPNPSVMDALLNGNGMVAERYRRLLAKNHRPFKFAFFKNQHVQNKYRWSCGNWWNLDVPVRGTGWVEGNWSIRRFHHDSYVRQILQKATLYFPLAPSSSPYLLRGKFKKIEVAERQNLQICLNQTPLTLQWKTKNRFEAKIDPAILLSSDNEIAFEVLNTDTPSLALSWFEVLPLKTPLTKPNS